MFFAYFHFFSGIIMEDWQFYNLYKFEDDIPLLDEQDVQCLLCGYGKRILLNDVVIAAGHDKEERLVKPYYTLVQVLHIRLDGRPKLATANMQNKTTSMNHIPFSNYHVMIIFRYVFYYNHYNQE
jgi:hypothetical protein